MVEIATFGETMLRLSPPAGERIESADRLECRVAGAESNVAIAAARLGAGVAWLSKLPDSVLGRRVAADVRSHDVDARVVWTDEGRQGTYYLEQAGRPRGTSVVYDRADAAVTTATPEELDTGAVESADVFFTTGITPALSETLSDTVGRLLETGTTTAFDLNYRSKLWDAASARAAYDDLLPHVDLLFAPERDARAVLGVDGDAAEIADTLRTRYDCDIVVVTRGAEGALASTQSRTVERPAVEADTVDPIGTGDAFVGAYLGRHVRGADVTECLRWATATAALKRTIAGDVALVSEAEVRDVLESTGSDLDR